MNVELGKGKTKYGPGVNIDLSGDEVATAIDAYLVAHDIHVSGPRTITVNNELCSHGHIYVDPSGFVIHEGEKIDGRGVTGRIVTIRLEEDFRGCTKDQWVARDQKGTWVSYCRIDSQWPTAVEAAEAMFGDEISEVVAIDEGAQGVLL